MGMDNEKWGYGVGKTLCNYSEMCKFIFHFLSTFFVGYLQAEIEVQNEPPDVNSELIMTSLAPADCDR